MRDKTKMRKIKLIFLLSSFCILLTSCGYLFEEQKKYEEQKITTIKILSLKDSMNLGFCSIHVFRKGECVLNTSADLDGRFSFSQPIEKIALIYAASYPKYIYYNDLKNDSIFFLKKSKIMVKSRGTGTDIVMFKLLSDIRNDITEWNKNNCPKIPQHE